MDTTWRTILWSQFGAAIDMLDNAIRACPDDLWIDQSQRQQYWYIAYHTLFWLDLYLSGTDIGFAPPAPFDLNELDPAGLMPDRVFSKDELQTYTEHCRQKCKSTINDLTDASVFRICKLSTGREFIFVELLLYTMRHVQEHASQLSWILGDEIDESKVPGWVGRTKR